jgi:hypothetical protein
MKARVPMSTTTLTLYKHSRQTPSRCQHRRCGDKYSGASRTWNTPIARHSNSEAKLNHAREPRDRGMDLQHGRFIWSKERFNKPLATPLLLPLLSLLPASAQRARCAMIKSYRSEEIEHVVGHKIWLWILRRRF